MRPFIARTTFSFRAPLAAAGNGSLRSQKARSRVMSITLMPGIDTPPHTTTGTSGRAGGDGD